MNSEPVEVTVKITEECIRDGVKSSCDTCPAALAIDNELVPGVYYARVYNSTFNIAQRGEGASYVFSGGLPREVSRFIERFDRGGFHNVEPMEFKIELPTYLLKETDNAISS